MMFSPGQKVNNRYLIDANAEIKVGGMGWVYKVFDERLQRTCCLKQLNLASQSGFDKQKMESDFQKEAQLLANLSHPNLPRVWDYFIDNGEYFIVMDYVDGVDLQKLRESKSAVDDISESEVFNWSIGVLDVLEYLHDQMPPVIYRDLKPSNVMLNGSGGVKVIDFGIAKRLESNPTGGAQTKSGTYGYAPIEQHMGKAEKRSDIYALGMTMYFLLTSRVPDLVNNESVRAINSHVSLGLESVINRATQTQLNQRFQSAGEMKSALVNLATGSVNLPFPTTMLPAKVINKIDTQVLIEELVQDMEKSDYTTSIWQSDNHKDDYTIQAVGYLKRFQAYYLRDNLVDLARREMKKLWSERESFNWKVLKKITVLRAMFEHKQQNLKLAEKLFLAAAKLDAEDTFAYNQISVIREEIKMAKEKQKSLYREIKRLATSPKMSFNLFLGYGIYMGINWTTITGVNWSVIVGLFSFLVWHSLYYYSDSEGDVPYKKLPVISTLFTFPLLTLVGLTAFDLISYFWVLSYFVLFIIGCFIFEMVTIKR